MFGKHHPGSRPCFVRSITGLRRSPRFSEGSCQFLFAVMPGGCQPSFREQRPPMSKHIGAFLESRGDTMSFNSVFNLIQNARSSASAIGAIHHTGQIAITRQTKNTTHDCSSTSGHTARFVDSMMDVVVPSAKSMRFQTDKSHVQVATIDLYSHTAVLPKLYKYPIKETPCSAGNSHVHLQSVAKELADCD